jgi:hypothetical protein
MLFFLGLPRASARPCGPDLKKGDFCHPDISELHPTQTSVGMVDVAAKRAEMAGLDSGAMRKYLRENRVVVVIGPEGKLYMIDRHHTTRAAYAEGRRDVYAVVEDNLSHLSEEDFWAAMKKRRWVRLMRPDGILLEPAAMPKHIRSLPDDPYRSLAWIVRKSEGFEKTNIPFAEFEWADYFREKITEAELKDWDGAVKEAIRLATTNFTKGLPGHLPVKEDRRPFVRDACWARFQALALPRP